MPTGCCRRTSAAVPHVLRDWARVLSARATLQQDPSLDVMSVAGALSPIGGGALLEIRQLIESGVSGRDLDRLDEAIALATHERLPVEAAEARMWALPLRPAAAAAEHAELAAATLQRCAVTGWTGRLAATAGVAASTSRPRDLAVESLSPAERRVADAVAGGLTNRETAASLIVSVKTVDFHLQQIYRKLGIRSRTELAIRIMHSSPSDISPPNPADITAVDVRSPDIAEQSMSDWWDNIEREMERLSVDAPDPWADSDVTEAATTLTDDQVAFLEQLSGNRELFADGDDWVDP